MIKRLAEEKQMTVNIKIITDPTKEDIEHNVEEHNKRVKYDKEEGVYADNQFNQTINVLNTHQISNIEKHRILYNHIQKEDELHFVIEDDVLVGEDYIQNIKELFDQLANNKLSDWDILFTCLSDVDNGSLNLRNSRDNYKLLLSKSSFFIRPHIAKQLAQYLEVYRYTLKNAISKFIWDNKSVKSRVLNKHTFLEGSKMGLFTTSINNSNFLYQNSSFMELARIAANETITDDMVTQAEKIYKTLEKLDNPDVLHTMGILYYKRKDYENAKKYMTESCEKIQSGFGYLSKSSEILNNAINIYQYDQMYLEECKTKQSKYSPLSTQTY